MKKIPRLISDNMNYPGHAFKIPTALIVGNALILFEEKVPYLVIFTNSGFYVAALFSSAVAYFTIRLVFWITRLLDLYFPWYRNHYKRLVVQLLLGVFIPIAPLCLMATVYFKIHHIDILKTVYFSRYLPVIGLLLIILSAYLHFYWEKMNRAKKTPKSWVVKKFRNVDLQMPYEEIAYIFAEDKVCYAVGFYGEKIIWNLTLRETMKHLPEALFFRPNRALIVNKMAIANVKVVNPKKSLIILAEPLKKNRFTDHVLSHIKKEFSPSSRENVAFKEWFVKEITE